MAITSTGGGGPIPTPPTHPTPPTPTLALVSAPILPTPTAVGDRDDRITSHALATFYKIMAWAGGVAILGWVLFGGFQWGRATTPTSAPTIIAQSALSKVLQPTQQPSSSWSSRDECERYYALELHEAPANRCNQL